ncbi:uncharacterized protein BXZ73DRAFT_75806 [Epithele typhae]|uniref:uncharacterized protein n=1 Tax=Epithele typhae TaxID=378194 RepID=UPI0020072667|nr:uncharacterized protein BXZ73DRAFT_75806 [Epithele typhae]KAH9940214.1 hypothetical protein BXZ73DRAFT_75806 [Epithele typhae]
MSLLIHALVATSLSSSSILLSGRATLVGLAVRTSGLWCHRPIMISHATMAMRSRTTSSAPLESIKDMHDYNGNVAGWVAMDRYYEWQTKGKERVPRLAERADGTPLLAGLWDSVKGPGPYDNAYKKLYTGHLRSPTPPISPTSPVSCPPLSVSLFVAFYSAIYLAAIQPSTSLLTGLVI